MSLPCGHPDTPLHNGHHISCPYPECQGALDSVFIQCFTDGQVVAEYQRVQYLPPGNWLPDAAPWEYRWEPVTKPGSI